MVPACEAAMSEHVSLIDLNDVYKIGIDSIDREHRYLIDLYNDLAQKVVFGTTTMQLNTAVDKLFDYAAQHFASEERLMWVTGFPNIESHKFQHESFVHTLTELVGQQQNKDDATALRQLAVFVGRWIRGHILISDKAFGEFISGRDEQAEPDRKTT